MDWVIPALQVGAFVSIPLAILAIYCLLQARSKLPPIEAELSQFANYHVMLSVREAARLVDNAESALDFTGAYTTYVPMQTQVGKITVTNNIPIYHPADYPDCGEARDWLGYGINVLEEQGTTFERYISTLKQLHTALPNEDEISTWQGNSVSGRTFQQEQNALGGISSALYGEADTLEATLPADLVKNQKFFKRLRVAGWVMGALAVLMAGAYIAYQLIFMPPMLPSAF